MNVFSRLFAGCLALGAALAPVTAAAQSSAAPYTAAVRYDGAGRTVGTIAPDPDGTGPLHHMATRTTYDARQLPSLVETGELTSWKDDTVLPDNWGSDFVVQTSVETVYDANRRKVKEITRGHNPSGGSQIISLTQYSYDARGRLECTALRMNPAVFNSLPASACTLGTEGAHGPDRITKTVYDGASQLLQVRMAVGTPLEKADVTYTYTLNGQIEHVIDANGNKAKLEYDDFDRQTKWIFPSKARVTTFDAAATPDAAVTAAGALSTDDGVAATDDYEEYTYDQNGNRLTLRKRDGSVIIYEYDALNRMTKKLMPTRADLTSLQQRDVVYGYDLRGLQTYARFVDASGPGVTYTYDGFGRLESETQDTSGTARAVTSDYDLHGNRTSVTYHGGVAFGYAYDGLDRLTNIDLANGTTFAAFPYNERGLVTAINAGGQTNFGYDNAGRVSSIGLDLLNTAHDVTWNYTRNPASQILTETQDNASYSWDGAVDFDRSYTTNGLNQYESAGTQAFCYDPNGNLTADGENVYKYDHENRLVARHAQGTGNIDCAALDYSGALLAELIYDPTGRLVTVSDGTPGAALHFLYDGNALIAEYNASGGVLRRYVHGGNVEADDPIAWFEDSAVDTTTIRLAKADPRGSIVAWTDFNGDSLAINSYDEYGIPDSATGDDIATKGRFRYTGQAWIPELGMYYYKARIYSPTLGRFLQTDPIGYEDQFNLYAYVGNDPINAVDSNGLKRRRLEAGISIADGPGAEATVGVEYDDETGEIGLSLEIGLNVGVGGDAGFKYTEERSSKKGNTSRASAALKAEVDVGIRAGDSGVGARAVNRGGFESGVDSEGNTYGIREFTSHDSSIILGPNEYSNGTVARPESQEFSAGFKATAGIVAKQEVNINLSEFSEFIGNLLGIGSGKK